MLAFHQQDLAALAARDRLRTLQPRLAVDLASNEYLGLAASPRLAAAVARLRTTGNEARDTRVVAPATPANTENATRRAV